MMRMLRNLALAAAAILCLQIWVVGSYRVTSPSMEPTLRGGGETSDRLLAWKLGARLHDPRRFDLVVFERPSSALAIVKRVVGLGGERIQIDHGNVWISRGEGPLRVVRKTLAQIHAMAVRVAGDRGLPSLGDLWSYDPARWEGEEGGFRLRADRGELRFLRIVRVEGPAGDPEGEAAGDLLLRLEVRRLPRGAGLEGTLVEDGTRYGFEASTRGTPLALLVDGEARGGADRALPAGRPFVLEFLNVDDRFAVAVDGEVWASIDVDATDPEASPSPGTNGASFEVEGEGSVLDAVSLWRDLHYTRRGSYGTQRPYAIPPGSVFVLGDASARSEDSREWGEIPVDAIRARPFLVFWPPSRWREL